MSRILRYFALLALCAMHLPPVSRVNAAEEASPLTPLQAQDLLAEAKRLEAADRFSEAWPAAANRAQALYARVSKANVPRALRDDAYFGQARVLLALGKPWEAHLATEKSFPARFDAQPVRARVTLQYRAAKELMALGDKQIQTVDEDEKMLSGYRAASIVFGSLVYNDPQSPFAAESLVLQADCLIHDKAHEEAETAYRKVMKYFPATREALHAHAGVALAIVDREWPGGMPREQAQVVEQFLLECDAALDDDPELKKRVDRVKAIQGEAAAAERLEKARFHIRRGSRADRRAAVFILRDLLSRYPDSPSSAQAREELARLGEEVERENP